MAPEDMHEDYDEELDFGLGSQNQGSASASASATSIVEKSAVVPGN